jgi:tryptophan halogenase
MFPKIAEGFSTVNYWLKSHLDGGTSTYGDVCSPLQALCARNKAPRRLPNSELPDPGFRYAYHFDATLVAEKLARVAKARGVRHIPADITEVVLAENGHISHLRTEQSGDVHGEYFIDCSGFRGLLINQALKEPFISDNHFLLCDSAVALPASSDPERDGLRPYTSATAMGDGWIWEIPLSHREGCGYVYCGGTVGRDDAEAQLRTFLGEERVANSRANHIKMRVGHNRRSWVKNCASVGLSSCFVEPLESTTIFLIEYEVAALAQQFPDSDFDERRSDYYNRSVDEMYEDIRDFIVMHYCTSNRVDTEFWRRVQQAPIPDSLSERLERVREGVLVPDGLGVRLFESRSTASILSGMQFEFKKCPPITAMIGQDQARQVFADIDAERTALCETMPDHYACVRKLYDAG